MKANYFRTMFHNVSGGMVHSLAVADSGIFQSCRIYYLCGGKEPDSLSEQMDNRFFFCDQNVRLAVVGDTEQGAKGLVKRLAAKNRVQKIVIPKGCGDLKDELGNLNEKIEVVELNTDESLTEREGPWQFRMKCYGDGEERHIIMYSSPLGMSKEKMDCLMNVKPFDNTTFCEYGIDLANQQCGMRCGLYNDFEVCKGHNARNGRAYVTGNLLLGSISLDKWLWKIKEDFEEEECIRFVATMDGDMSEVSGKRLLHWILKYRPELNHYIILPGDNAGSGRFIKEILLTGGRGKPFLTGKNCGVCGSGFFTLRE